MASRKVKNETESVGWLIYYRYFHPKDKSEKQVKSRFKKKTKIELRKELNQEYD